MDLWHIIERESHPPDFVLLLEHVLCVCNANYKRHFEQIFIFEDSFSGEGVIWLSHLRIDECLLDLMFPLSLSELLKILVCTVSSEEIIVLEKVSREIWSQICRTFSVRRPLNHFIPQPITLSDGRFIKFIHRARPRHG
jgi:hypothetical protein